MTKEEFAKLYPPCDEENDDPIVFESPILIQKPFMPRKLNKPQQAFLEAILKLDKGQRPILRQRCPGRALMREQIERWMNYFCDDRMSDERTQELSETSSPGVLERT